jgi:hypothetical protein
VTFLVLCRLPRLDHAVFEVQGFERATRDRFFLAIDPSDPRFEPVELRRELSLLGARRFVEVPS